MTVQTTSEAMPALMGDQGIKGAALTLFSQIQKRLDHFKEYLDVPTPPIELDDLLVSQGSVSGK
jgi:hypothetical protein